MPAPQSRGPLSQNSTHNSDPRALLTQRGGEGLFLDSPMYLFPPEKVHQFAKAQRRGDAKLLTMPANLPANLNL